MPEVVLYGIQLLAPATPLDNSRDRGGQLCLLVLRARREVVSVWSLALISVQRLRALVLLGVHPELLCEAVQDLGQGALDRAEVVHHVHGVNGRQEIQEFARTFC